MFFGFLLHPPAGFLIINVKWELFFNKFQTKLWRTHRKFPKNPNSFQLPESSSNFHEKLQKFSKIPNKIQNFQKFAEMCQEFSKISKFTASVFWCLWSPENLQQAFSHVIISLSWNLCPFSTTINSKDVTITSNFYCGQQ